MRVIGAALIADGAAASTLGLRRGVRRREELVCRLQ